MGIKITATYILSTEWDYEECLADIGVQDYQVVEWFVKYDTLNIIYANKDGGLETAKFENWSNEQFDFKRPTTCVMVDEDGNKIETQNTGA